MSFAYSRDKEKLLVALIRGFNASVAELDGARAAAAQNVASGLLDLRALGRSSSSAPRRPA